MKYQFVRLVLVVSAVLLGTGGCAAPGGITSIPLLPTPSFSPEPEATDPSQSMFLSTATSLTQTTILSTTLTPTAGILLLPIPLNEEVSFNIDAQFPDIPEFLSPSSAQPPTGTQYIIHVNVPCGSTSSGYAIIGDLTEAKWHLAEYDALTQNCFRGDIVGSTRILDMLSLEVLQRLFNERYSHYRYHQSIVYPPQLQEIHALYLSCHLGPESYWSTYDPDNPFTTEVPYSRINELYNSYVCQRAMAEADYRLFKLLDEEGIYPLYR